MSLEEGAESKPRKSSEVSAFLDGGAIGVGRKLWQAGFLCSGVVGEDRVLARGAGGAAGVGVTLVQRHRQLQILLGLQTGVNFDLRPTDLLRLSEETDSPG